MKTVHQPILLYTEHSAVHWHVIVAGTNFSLHFICWSADEPRASSQTGALIEPLGQRRVE